MDLLGNYSSSDDDDDSSKSSERSRSPPTPIVKKTSSLLQVGTLPSSMPSPQKPAAIKAAVGVKKNPGGGSSKRGKKLISLHAVLPPHILEQLTKSEATGDFEDSSDDEEEISSSSKKKKAARKEPSSKSAASKDEGITNFLSALGSAKTKGALKVNKTTTTSSNTPKEKSQSSSEGKLGAAFMSVTTTTTTRNKKDGTESSTTTTNNSTVDPRSTPTSQQEANVDSPSHYKPLSLSPRTAFHPFPNSKVSAAPPIPSSRIPPAAVPAVVQQYDNRPRQVVAPPPPPVMAEYGGGGGGGGFHSSTLDTTTVAGAGGAASSRSKKRQLQKALRAGNLDHALATAGAAGNVTNLDQARPTAYVPEPETYATPAHGVRVVATAMYNPKAGTDVQANMGAVRARGKNQINQLMASAANFELQQARSGQKSNNQRAGTKRKYGW